MWTSKQIQPNPLNALWNFATGHLPDFLNKQDGPVGWVRWSHRGVQFLDQFSIPRKQKSYIFNSGFELRFNTAFEEVLRACADPNRDYIQRRSGQSWITDELIAALLALRKMGFAHSFETWHEQRLVGGIWGVQIGGLITMSSMFNRVSNASKAAMARTMLHLKDRGFTLVDMGMVPDHLVHFGAQWIPRWQYESLLPYLIHQRLSLTDEFPAPDLPRSIAWRLPVLRAMRALRRRLATDRPDDERMEVENHANGNPCADSAHPSNDARPIQPGPTTPGEPTAVASSPQYGPVASERPKADPDTAAAPPRQTAKETAAARLD